MKLKFLPFLGSLTFLSLFTACSNDIKEPEINNPESSSQTKIAYANIKLKLPSDNSTRAGEQFNAGSAEESAVKNLLIVFYKEDGSVAGTITDFTPAGGSEEPDVTSTLAAKIELNTQDLSEVKEALAFINYGDSWGLRTANLSTVKSMYDDIPIRIKIGEDQTEYFCMSSAGYYDNDNTYKITTDVEGKIYATQDQAEAAGENGVITMYVERIAAKLDVTTKDTQISAFKVIKGGSGSDNAYNLNFQITNVGVTAIAKQTYLLKNSETSTDAFDETFPTGFGTWVKYNSEVSHRSFWANSVGYGNDNSYPSNSGSESYLLDYTSFDNLPAVTNEGKYSTYLMENTFKASTLQSVANPFAVPTSIVVYGKYTVTKAPGDNVAGAAEEPSITDNDGTFYLRKIGNDYHLFNTETLKSYLVALQTVIAKDDKGSKLDSNTDCFDLSSAGNSSNGYTLTLKNASALYYYNSTTKTWTQIGGDNTAAAKALAENVGVAYKYDKGCAYFYVPVQHYLGGASSVAEENFSYDNYTDILTGQYGIVRNHWYDLTVKSISGLGAGKEGDQTFPLPDSEESYQYSVSAELKVLDWHDRSYDVEL